MDNYENVVRDFMFKEIIKKNRDEIKDDTSLVESGIIDSIDIMRVITFLTNEMDFELEDDEYMLENFDSISKIISFVQKKMSN